VVVFGGIPIHAGKQLFTQIGKYFIFEKIMIKVVDRLTHPKMK
jgi:hypothetical protein